MAAAPAHVEGDVRGPALSVRGLTVSYGGRGGITDVELVVPSGTCTGLVGPNGSGKSTTLRAVLGMVHPERGAVTVHGVDAIADPVAARGHIGAVLDPLLLFERLTGHELVESLGELRGMERATVSERATELFGLLDLNGPATRRISGYSHGMRKKTALVAALVHRPRLLLLDEPFEGLDPVSARAVRQVLGRFLAGGGSIVISSHAMDVLERIADQLAVLHEGRVVTAGPTIEVLAGRRLEDAFFDVLTGLESGDAGSTAVPDSGSLAWLR